MNAILSVETTSPVGSNFPITISCLKNPYINVLRTQSHHMSQIVTHSAQYRIAMKPVMSVLYIYFVVTIIVIIIIMIRFLFGHVCQFTKIIHLLQMLAKSRRMVMMTGQAGCAPNY